MIKSKPWFEIDRKGLAQILARKGKEFAIFELAQNAWDEDGVNSVAITLQPDTTPGYCFLKVVDNAPEGFRSLTDAYTLFAPSQKKRDPEKRGRFNLGEKFVLALCKEARVITTTGSVNFSEEEGRVRGRTKTKAGSEIHAVFRMSSGEIKDTILACRRLIPPLGIITTVNGLILDVPQLLTSFPASLLSEVSNANGELVKVTRKTTVDVYAEDEAHPAAIYEMGIPVCEIEGKYCLNVRQKVPLTIDREEILPQFRKQLAVAVLNAMPEKIDTADVNTGWATEAAASPDISKAGLDAYVTQRFGEKRVIYDPSDLEANHRAAAEGYTVITGSQLSKAAWSNVKEHGAALPAGQVTPSAKPYSEDGDELPKAEVTPKMSEVGAYAQRMSLVLLGRRVLVDFRTKVSWPYSATYGPSGHLVFNVGRLGKAWFDLTNNHEAIDNLLIHEFGHEYSLNHLSEDYYRALTKLGAGLANAIRNGKLV